MSDIEVLERAVVFYGYRPSSHVIDEARAWIEARRRVTCEICEESIDLEQKGSFYRSILMRNPAPTVCNKCGEIWYERGLTDIGLIRAEREKQRQLLGAGNGE